MKYGLWQIKGDFVTKNAVLKDMFSSHIKILGRIKQAIVMCQIRTLSFHTAWAGN